MACLVGFHGLEQWLQFQDWGQQLSLYIKKNGPTAPRCEYIVFFDRSVSTSRKRGTLPLGANLDRDTGFSIVGFVSQGKRLLRDKRRA